jgi:hypothetical protein
MFVRCCLGCSRVDWKTANSGRRFFYRERLTFVHGSTNTFFLLRKSRSMFWRENWHSKSCSPTNTPTEPTAQAKAVPLSTARCSSSCDELASHLPAFFCFLLSRVVVRSLWLVIELVTKWRTLPNRSVTSSFPTKSVMQLTTHYSATSRRSCSPFERAMVEVCTLNSDQDFPSLLCVCVCVCVCVCGCVGVRAHLRSPPHLFRFHSLTRSLV